MMTMSGTTTTRVDSNLVPQSLLLLQDFLYDILTTIGSLNSLESSNNYNWNLDVTRITHDIGTFVELTTLLSKALSKHHHLEIPSIKQSHIHLLFIMKAMNQASQKQDLVVLEELIKYELKDNLTQWKIDLIPQMKRHLNL
jgi:hypothetical protein